MCIRDSPYPTAYAHGHFNSVSVSWTLSMLSRVQYLKSKAPLYGSLKESSASRVWRYKGWLRYQLIVARCQPATSLPRVILPKLSGVMSRSDLRWIIHIQVKCFQRKRIKSITGKPRGWSQSSMPLPSSTTSLLTKKESTIIFFTNFSGSVLHRRCV